MRHELAQSVFFDGALPNQSADSEFSSAPEQTIVVAL